MNPKITVAVCCGVLVVALASLWLRFKPATTRFPRQEIIGVQTGLGQALGEATAKAVPDHSRVVLITTSTPAQFKKQSSYLWNAFESELQKHSVSITVEQSALNVWNSGSLSTDQAAFKGLLDRHADAAAVVFLVDLPEWGRMAEAFPQYAGPKIIAMDNLRQQMKLRYSGYFANGMMVALIGENTQPGPPSQPKTSREWFDRFYQVYTPQNYESLLQPDTTLGPVSR